MGKVDPIIPIFYVRGYNPPFNEGHIVVVKMMVKSLLLQNIRSIIFNYDYKIEENKAIYSRMNCEENGEIIYEQKIPLVKREELFHKNIKSKIGYASLMETINILKFWSIERHLRRKGLCIVNVINCFRYPRIIAKNFFKCDRAKPPLILHFYTRKIAMKKTFKMLIDKTDLVITSSKSLASYLEKKYNIGKLKVQIMYPPINTEIYKPIDKGRSRRSLGLKKSSKILLYLGNLRKHRFPEDIILKLMEQLVKKDPRIKLYVFSPKNNENVKRRIKILTKASAFNLRQNVKINVKNLSEVEKSFIYSASDIFLFPPLISGETVEPPITVLEAMSCGLPVISSDVQSITEIIKDKVDGLIIPFGKGNPLILKENIFSLLEDSNLRMEFSYKARRNVIENLTLNKSCKRLIDIFQSLSESNPYHCRLRR